jgi:MFS superfamily sulfate permease-like transporter
MKVHARGQIAAYAMPKPGRPAIASNVSTVPNNKMRKGDLIAGLSVAGLLLPEAVAYAAIAGLPPQRAIFAGIAGCLVYAMAGQSRFAITSPTSSSAAILAAILASFAIAPEQKPALVTAVVLLTAAFFILAAMTRLGSLTGLIARPVLRGFSLGLAINIIIKQLPAIAGVSVHAPDIFHLGAGIIASAPQWNWISIGCGTLALVVLLLLKRFPAIPVAFLVLAAGIAASIFLNLPALGVAVVGPIDTNLVAPSLPAFSFDQWSRLAQLALPLAMILFAESWGTISALALRHNDEVSANRELGALGVSNLASALVQGMPVGAGFSAGSASEAAGALTRWTSVVASIGLAMLIAFASPLVAKMPQPVLAAVVIAALVHALNPAPLLRLLKLRRDFNLAIAAAISVLVLGVLNGMLVAVVLSLAMVIHRLASPRVARLARLGDSRDYVDASRHADAKIDPDVAIWRPAEPLLFANAEAIFRYIESQTHNNDAVRAVIVSLEESFDLDSTALEVIASFDAVMAKSGKQLLLARVHDHVRDALVSAGLADLQSRCHYSVDGAVLALGPPVTQSTASK